MLGTLRLVLALMVVLSHAGVRVVGLNPGVIAVIGFYLISGYVMAGLIRRHYRQPAQAGAFYLDRAVRLLPQYFFYIGLTLAWYFFSRTETLFLSHPPTAGDLFNNLLIVPLNFYMFNGSDHFTLIPPAWSLGAEVQFYLIAPFILIWPKRVLAAALLSLSIYLAALGGLINSDWFGYRLLPGTLLFFLLGAYLQQLHQRQQSRRAAAITTLVALLAISTMGALLSYGTLRLPYNFETLIGLLFGITLLCILATRARTRWDSLAGDISYGVFLNHFLILWTVFPRGVNAAQLPVLLALSIALAWLTQRYMEKPLLRLRHRFRAGTAPGSRAQDLPLPAGTAKLQALKREP